MINGLGVSRNPKPVQHIQPLSHLSPMDHGRPVCPGCTPITPGSAGMLAHKPSCCTKPRHEQCLSCWRTGKTKPRSSAGNLPLQDAPPPPPGLAPRPQRARHWGQPVAEVLTSFFCREGLAVGLARRISGCFAEDSFASRALRCPPYLCPEICERVCAYVCVRLELSGIFHAGHAFPCLQQFPPSPQARRQTCLPWNRPPRRRPPLPRTPRHSAKFLSSLISRVLCVCVCPCTLWFFSPPTPHPPSSPLCQMAKICLSIGSEASAKTEGKDV